MDKYNEPFDINNLDTYSSILFYGRPHKSISQSEAIYNKNKDISSYISPTFENSKKWPVLQGMVIRLGNKYKSTWDFYVLWLTLYSCVTSAFYAAFDIDSLQAELGSFEIFVEVCFGIDIILKFFSAYEDDQTFEEVSDFFKISRNYL